MHLNQWYPLHFDKHSKHSSIGIFTETAICQPRYGINKQCRWWRMPKLLKCVSFAYIPIIYTFEVCYQVWTRPSPPTPHPSENPEHFPFEDRRTTSVYSCRHNLLWRISIPNPLMRRMVSALYGTVYLSLCVCASSWVIEYMRARVFVCFV